MNMKRLSMIVMGLCTIPLLVAIADWNIVFTDGTNLTTRTSSATNALGPTATYMRPAYVASNNTYNGGTTQALDHVTVTNVTVFGPLTATVAGSVSNSLNLGGVAAASYLTTSYVKRPGDIAVHDLTPATVVKDGAWHTWDLSSIVPAGTVGANIHCVINATVAGANIVFREYGKTNTIITVAALTQVSGIYMFGDGTVNLSSDLKVEYNATTNTGNVYASISGWFK